MIGRGLVRMSAAVAVLVASSFVGSRAVAEGEALVIHSAGLETILGSPKDQPLLGMLQLVDERLAELPGQIPDADEEGLRALALAWDILRSPMTLRAIVDVESEDGPPFSMSLVVDAENAAGASELATRLTSMVESAGLAAEAADGGRMFQSPMGPLMIRADGNRMALGMNTRAFDAPDPAFARLPDGASTLFGMSVNLKKAQPLIEMMGLMADPEAEAMRPLLEKLGLIGENALVMDSAWGVSGNDGVGYWRVKDARGSGTLFSMPEGVSLGEDLIRAIPDDATYAQASVVDFGFIDFFFQLASEQGGEDVYAMVEQETGIHPKRDLLDHLGNRLAFYQSDRTGGGGMLSSVAMVHLSEAGAFKETHARLVGMINGMARSEANGHVRVRSWEGPGGELFSLTTPGLPIPIELSWGVVGEWAVVAASPRALMEAIGAMAEKGQGLAGHPRLRELAGRDLSSLVFLEYQNTEHHARSGYAAMSLVASALSNAVRSPGSDRQPPSTMVSFAELTSGVRPALSIGRWDGDDLVVDSRFDRSVTVNGAAVVGQLGGLMGVQAAAMGMGILMPATTRARSNAMQLKSSTQVRNIAQGMIIYSATNQDRYPTSFDAMLEEGIISRETLSSPFGPSWDGGADFAMAPSGMNDADFEKVIAFDRAMWVNSEDVVNVGFADGHVQAMQAWELEELAQQPKNAWVLDAAEGE